MEWPAERALIRYAYFLGEPEGGIVHDWGIKTVRLHEFEGEHVLLLDSWNNASYIENAFYTEPFQQVLLRKERGELPASRAREVTHRFEVRAPLLRARQTLGLVGTFNGWDTGSAVLLGRRANAEVLEADVDFPATSLPLEYKYVVWDLSEDRFVEYEAGENRFLPARVGRRTVTRVDDGFARLASTTWHGAGVAVPVFSLRSEGSFGTGEFPDLKLLVDWCVATGLKLIQVLPVNDTSATHTRKDSYPYSAISAFALHPLYLDLKGVAAGRHGSLLSGLEPERQRLNALESLDYEAVMKAKLSFLREVFPLERTAVLGSEGFREFLEQNRTWLVPYAAFCVLRDQYGTTDYQLWPRLGRYDGAAVEAMSQEGSEHYEGMLFHYFMQYQLHLQLKEASEYAHSSGVILKGDIPIGVSRHGADAWQAPELYHLEVQAGAPPDAFAVKGQNWGFPTYNWGRMKRDGFKWWKRRFAQMSSYFDAFRIDHILGFFRIWSIPADAVEGVLGHFEPALPVEPEEFGARGIAFDRARLVEPHITDVVLEEVFGASALTAARGFLKPDGRGYYALRPEFRAQRQVEAHFAGLADTEENRGVKQGLFDLISNVILLETGHGEGQEFHIRFGVEWTRSFKALPANVQSVVRELYADYFFRRQDEFWRRGAMEKLPALKRVTNMLVCGEDLGLVPVCVPEVMRQLGLLSLEIQRMPKNPGQRFFRPSESPYLAVVTPSTHDMSTIRSWWQEDRAVTQEFYEEELGGRGPAPEECSGELNRAIVRQHLAAPAMWSIFQLQDLMGSDESIRRRNPDEERINVPAVAEHYWRYRMHVGLEDLLQAKSLNALLREDVRNSGR